MTLSIEIIHGKAGTGKSTKLSDLIHKCCEDDVEFIVMTATHASLMNIYHKCNDGNREVYRSKFKTIYSFFRIDFHNNSMLGARYIPEYMFIDEFSLIRKDLFKKIIMDIQRKIHDDAKLVLCGDAMQLNAIYIDKQYISFNKLVRYNELLNNNFDIDVIKHVHQSIFGTKLIKSAHKTMLTTNHRMNSDTTTMLNAIYSRDTKYKYRFVDIIHLINLLVSPDDYVVLSSRYSILQGIYDKLSERWSDKIVIEQNVSYRYGMKRLYLYPGIDLMITATSDNRIINGEPDYHNGQIVSFTGNIENEQLKCIDKNDGSKVIWVNKEVDHDGSHGEYYFPVIPAKLMTIHKSQGQTLDNVIICIDDLFEITMLYTAITRAKNNVLFYTIESNGVNKLFDSAHIDKFKRLNALINQMN